MGKLIQARVDDELLSMLDELKVQGYSESEAIREGIRLLNQLMVPGGPAREIVGMGKFNSGKKDLGSNKKHLKGFGRD